MKLVFQIALGIALAPLVLVALVFAAGEFAGAPGTWLGIFAVLGVLWVHSRRRSEP